MVSPLADHPSIITSLEYLLASRGLPRFFGFFTTLPLEVADASTAPRRRWATRSPA